MKQQTKIYSLLRRIISTIGIIILIFGVIVFVGMLLSLLSLTPDYFWYLQMLATEISSMIAGIGFIIIGIVMIKFAYVGDYITNFIHRTGFFNTDATQKQCPQCQSWIKSDEKRCVNCGHDFNR